MDYWHFEYACPYYKWSTKTDVHCEAGSIKLSTGTRCRRHLKDYCCDVKNYHNCLLAKVQDEFYEEIENDNAE